MVVKRKCVVSLTLVQLVWPDQQGHLRRRNALALLGGRIELHQVNPLWREPAVPKRRRSYPVKSWLSAVPAVPPLIDTGVVDD